MSSSYSYHINTPTEFVNTTGGNGILFNSEAFVTGDSPTQNIAIDFCTTMPTDVIFRNSQGTANTLQRLKIGSPGNVLTVVGTSTVAQIVDITTVQASSIPQSSYFLLNSPSTGYYVWYNKDGGGTDPGLNPPSDLFIPQGSAKLRTGVQIAVSSGDSSIVVASTTAGVLTALSEFTSTSGGAVITIVNVDKGVADAPSDGSVSTGFGPFTVTTPGNSPTLGWVATDPGSVDDTFLAMAVASSALAVAPGSTWVTLDSTVVTWDKTGDPKHDAGNIFNTSTGVFTIPARGIYLISATVAFEGNNSGGGGGGIPGRRAIRQARIYDQTTGVTLIFAEIQANGYNDNPPQVCIMSSNIQIDENDEVVLQVRHDASVSLAVSVNIDGTPTIGPSTFFTAHRTA